MGIYDHKEVRVHCISKYELIMISAFPLRILQAWDIEIKY